MMENVRYLLVTRSSVLCLYLCSWIHCHPQCLDFTPPNLFNNNDLPFCTIYREEGCCTPEEGLKLEARYSRIKDLIPDSKQALWISCRHYVQEFLCLECSPYAAHIFDMEIKQNESNPIPRAFPGICPPECVDFHTTCQEIVSYYMQEAGPKFSPEAIDIQSALDVGVEEFCRKNKLTDMTYCYPWLIDDPALHGDKPIDKVTEEGCLCMVPYYDIRHILTHHPVFLLNAGDGSNRMFIGEQNGKVHIMYPNGTILPNLFADIQSHVKYSMLKWDERGMLGMAFHPNFVDNRKLYILYSVAVDKSLETVFDHKTRVEEFKISEDDSNTIDYNYGRIIKEINEPFANHNGGQILFGDDGYMYLFIGDGGGGGDPLSSGQDLFSMLGKVHRIDVDHVDVVRQTEYSIPPDNPYADGVNGLPEIYAYGVRNIWRCGKDRGDPITKEGKGRIVCGDVGQSAREEINLIEKGANYGWKIREGSIDYCPYCNRSEPEKNFTEPIWDYPHSVGKSVTGGNFYRGCQNPNLNGYYIYGDFMNGKLFRLLHDPATNTWNNKQLKMCESDYCKPPLTNDYSTSIISFGEDEAGEVYMLSTSYASTTVYQGTVYRIVDPVRRGNPADCDPDYQAPTTAGAITPAATNAARTTCMFLAFLVLLNNGGMWI